MNLKLTTDSCAQVGLPVVYRGVRLDLGYRMDLLVENLVIVEVKAVDAVTTRALRPGHLLLEIKRQVYWAAH
jgi:GxxExxY protein